MMTISYQEMMDKASQISDYYADLQQDIFYLLIDATKSTRNLLVDRDMILEWRLEMLAKMGALTKEVIKLVAQTSGKTEKAINELIRRDGLQVAQDINDELSSMLNKSVPISSEVSAIVNSYTKQTFLSLDNNVNQTLITTNYGQNSAMKTYQDIINQTVLEVQAGIKTPQRALADNIYKWQAAGMKSSMVDKGGHTWSLEGYTRTVIQSTAHRTFNDVRLQSMKDFDSPLAVMSSHPASRRACAFIQGHVVNVVPLTDKNANPKYDSIYNHGYGTAAGTQGINCSHMLYPYIEGVSHNYQKQYDPDDAMKNAKSQQRQRYLEREIRNDKKLIDLANRLGDSQGLSHYKSLLSTHRQAIRDHVKSHDFLNRQYNRERIYTKADTSGYNKAKQSESSKRVRFQQESGAWGKNVNNDMQSPHVKKTRTAGKSYFSDGVDTQALLDQYSGKGTLVLDRHGKFTNKEVVKGVSLPGSVIDTDGNEHPITGFTIHHSKKRTHIVPYAEKGDSK